MAVTDSSRGLRQPGADLRPAPRARRGLARAVPTPTSSELPPPEEVALPSNREQLALLREQLVLRAYSPRTRRVYLGHIRRFLTWCEGTGERASAETVRRFLMHLVEEQEVSRAYHSQAVSALRFHFETVLEESAVAQGIPRPKKEQRLPEVLSPDEVARLLGQVRHPKHRAILMVTYAAGLRVIEVVRLRPDGRRQHGEHYGRGGSCGSCHRGRRS